MLIKIIYFQTQGSFTLLFLLSFQCSVLIKFESIDALGLNFVK